MGLLKGFYSGSIPQGSMYSYSIYIGLQVVPMWVHWAQSICYMGTWTLRDRVCEGFCGLLS